MGEKTKAEVKALARALGLTAAELPESQDLCFAPQGIPALVPDAPPGPIVDLQGRVLGEHRGLPYYTVGQRRAWAPLPGALYVVALDPERNAVVVGPERALYASGLLAEDLHWIAGEPPAVEFPCEVQVRYRSLPVPAEVRVDGDQAVIRFAEPVRAVTPGQAAVFYRGRRSWGGAIREAIPPPARSPAGDRGRPGAPPPEG